MTITCEDLTAPASPPIRLVDPDRAQVEFLIVDVARQIAEGGADPAEGCGCGTNHCGCGS
jgi:hypothetical protein